MIEIPVEVFGWSLLIGFTMLFGFASLWNFAQYQTPAKDTYIPFNHGRIEGSFFLLILIVMWCFASLLLGWWRFV
jgi:hypothetical protein